MHIGIDGRFWFETGVGRYTRNLIKQLQIIDNKNQYTIFTSERNYPHIKPQLTNKNWQVIRTDIKWHSISEQMNLPKFLEKENLDLVHFPYFSVPIFYKGPYVVTIHDLILHHYATGEATTLPMPVYKAKLSAYKYIIKKAAQKSKKILTVSHATKDEIVRHLDVPKNKIFVTYEGIDPRVLQHTKSARVIKSPYLLHVGNVYPHKNMNQFLMAFKDSLPKIGKDTKLVIVGREDYFYKKFKALVELEGLKDRVVFIGDCTDTELESLYRNATALVIPSVMEGFGLPAIEAMANNCLVIASSIPSLKEICGEAGVYFDPQSKEDMVRVIADVMGAKKNYEKNNKLGLVLAKSFSWEKMAKETLKVYESSTSIRQSK